MEELLDSCVDTSTVCFVPLENDGTLHKYWLSLVYCQFPILIFVMTLIMPHVILLQSNLGDPLEKSEKKSNDEPFVIILVSKMKATSCFTCSDIVKKEVYKDEYYV
ncbi:putative transcriptional regulatory protein [Frankliniella fusca]|uniref:Transcriptional regulatory protein n=1 Tax=Frankliniella fusca TaxID=407009 RepID=A0AAE1HUN8_9NEOP|nr:putative transcriptional regulatory protein [Frankliniella fusca]